MSGARVVVDVVLPAPEPPLSPSMSVAWALTTSFLTADVECVVVRGRTDALAPSLSPCIDRGTRCSKNRDLALRWEPVHRFYHAANMCVVVAVEDARTNKGLRIFACEDGPLLLLPPTPPPLFF